MKRKKTRKGRTAELVRRDRELWTDYVLLSRYVPAYKSKYLNIFPLIFLIDWLLCLSVCFSSGTLVRWSWSQLDYVCPTPEEETVERAWKWVAWVRGRSAWTHSVSRHRASRCVSVPVCRRTRAPAPRSPLSPSQHWQHPFLRCQCLVLLTPPALPAPCPHCWHPPSRLPLHRPLHLLCQRRRSCHLLRVRVGMGTRLRWRVKRRSSPSPHSAHLSLASLTAASWWAPGKSWGRLQSLTHTADEVLEPFGTIVGG